MNILLVSPRTPDTFWSFVHALPFVSKRSTNPPLGLLTVAAMLPCEWNMRLVDLDIEPLRDRDLRWANYVLIGAMIVHRDSVHEIVARCRELDRTVIAGGPLFTTGHEDFPEIDHFVLGEAEDLIGQLVRDMQSGKLKRFYQADRFPSLEESPIPRWDLLDLDRYATMSVQFSRGCPHDCEFCDIVVLNGRVPRTKPPERLVAELESLHGLGWRGAVFIVDDNFIGHRRRAKELLRAIIAWRESARPEMDFITEATVDLARSRELLDLMVEAGFKKVFLGLETPDPESLRECHKTQNLREDLLDSVRRIQAAGLEVMGGFIIGFDSDPVDIDRHLVRFIQASGIPVAMTGLLNALPGSPLHHRFAREGRLLDTQNGQKGDNTFQFGFNFQPVQDAGRMIKAYKNVLLEVYGKPGNYFRRVTQLYRNLGHGLASKSPLTPRRLRACLRSLVMIPTSKYGWSYGSFLLCTLVRYPTRIQDAIRHGIVGFHFYKLTHERLAVDEFTRFVNSAVERVREAYDSRRDEGVRLAAQLLAEGRKRLRRLPASVRSEMREFYEELERTVRSLGSDQHPLLQ